MHSAPLYLIFGNLCPSHFPNPRPGNEDTYLVGEVGPFVPHQKSIRGKNGSNGRSRKKISNAPIFRIGGYNRLFGSVVNIGLKKKVGPQVVRLKKKGDVKESPSKFGPRRHRSHEYGSEMYSSNR